MTGIEPFIEPAAGGLVGTVFDLAKRVGGGVTKVIGNYRQASQALQRYEDRYRASYGSLKLLGMQKSVELEMVYTNVRFLNELSIRKFTSLERLEKDYKERGTRQFKTQERARKSGSSIANECQYLMVLGSPGAGKSTYLRRVGLEALKGKRGQYAHCCIPVMLEMKQFNNSSVDITKAITHELKNFGFPESSEFTENALKQGKLLILLDGIDEIPGSHLNSVVDAIQKFVNQYDKNRYISSCRIAAHNSTWTRFRDIELADFNDDQIEQFIYHWFSSPKDRKSGTAQRCWEVLNEPGNVSAKELAQTPLLLTFIWAPRKIQNPVRAVLFEIVQQRR